MHARLVDEHESAVDLRRMAEILNVSYGTVYGMAQRGEIPTFRVGRRWRMIPSKVIAHLESKTAAEESDVMRQPPGSHRRRGGRAHPNVW